MIIYNDYGTYTSTVGEHLESLAKFLHDEVSALNDADLIENADHIKDIAETIDFLKQFDEDKVIKLELTDWAGFIPKYAPDKKGL